MRHQRIERKHTTHPNGMPAIGNQGRIRFDPCRGRIVGRGYPVVVLLRFSTTG